MLINIGTQLGAFFHEVFVAKFDFWLVFGMVAQFLFAGRFLVQWISSERAGKSIIPVAFWFFSMGGGLMTLVYGVVKREPVIIVGQTFGILVYLRNLYFINRDRRLPASQRAQ
ncbi:MAG: lipid-A-disaccharide synthase N-terminal domain-containing protein [Proteobacteria bacterium]|nr:lipid-A-disaccharide synthase N-terminal domain-containing protein [Pseudomonadota bacterium]